MHIFGWRYVGFSSVTLVPHYLRMKHFEDNIRDVTHMPNALRFLVEMSCRL